MYLYRFLDNSRMNSSCFGWVRSAAIRLAFLCSLPELVIILNWGLLAVVRQSAGQFSPAGPSLLSWTVQWPYHTIMLWQRMLSITCSGATEGRVHSLQFPEEEDSLLGLRHQNEGVQWPSQIQGDVEAREFDAIHTLHPPHTDQVDGCWTSKAFFCQLRAFAFVLQYLGNF